MEVRFPSCLVSQESYSTSSFSSMASSEGLLHTQTGALGIFFPLRIYWFFLFLFFV